MNQSSFANGFERSTRRTRRPALVVEMLAVVPWDALVDRISPYNQAGTTGRPTYPVRLLARVHFLQQWFSLVVEVAREVLCDIPLHRAFAGIAPGATCIPDATTIQRFRHFLERRHLAPALLRTLNEVLEAQGPMVRRGTLVDVDLHPRSG